jgi:hypothetical protein
MIQTRSKPINFIFDNLLLLLAGTAAAVVWANLDVASYDGVAHPLHFWANDVGMVFFFALAAKEVFEATLPGGSLASPRRALSPLAAAVGGMVAPAALYFGGFHALHSSRLCPSCRIAPLTWASSILARNTGPTRSTASSTGGRRPFSSCSFCLDSRMQEFRSSRSDLVPTTFSLALCSVSRSASSLLERCAPDRRKPETWTGFPELLLVGIAASIGFTVSLFFATAAFPAGSALAETKMGVLLSCVAAPLALIVSRVIRLRAAPAHVAAGVAESSRNASRTSR